MTSRFFSWPLFALLLVPMNALGADGKATLPVITWEQMLKELEQAAVPERPTVPVLQGERRIEGGLRKGLFSGTLQARFEVLDARHVRVPVLDAGAALGEVKLNGQRTSLMREGEMYTVGVDRPGVYDLRLQFFWGKEQDRFARRLRFRVPQAGSTALSVLIPERDIEAQLGAGVVTAQRERGDATFVEGHVDATGNLDLSWRRRLTHRSQAKVRMEVSENTVFTVHETLVEGLAAFDLKLLEGEADRVDLRLPDGIEVVGVEGDAVLQWQTEAKDGGRLIVLFRHLVEDATRVLVRFQFPVEANKPLLLAQPLPPEGAPLSGNVGVQAPAGLKVEVVAFEKAERHESGDLPPELSDLSESPLLFGFSFSEPLKIELKVTRNEPVSLTSTLVDDLQASTVVIEDGWEIAKVKLRIRNNTGQYLRVTLPKGAVLTHSLIDGRAVRPASSSEQSHDVLLLPLRQSERIEASGMRHHIVAANETLSHIANYYYADPSKWREIIAANPEILGDEHDLAVGQELRVPTLTGSAAMEESAFVIELAYKLKHDPLDSLGRMRVQLPEIDVETVQVTWHLYLPAPFLPLRFDANLTQYSGIRYDPFRRVRDFLRRAIFIDDAWAGGRYENIFSQRKAIYAVEAQSKADGKMVLASFPLVGERYRFERILLGRDTPQISVTYADHLVAPVLRWLAFVIACSLTLLLFYRRTRRTWMVAGFSLLALLVLAYYFLGVHRRMLWGVDLALLAVLVRARGGLWWRAIVEHARRPWKLLQLVTLPNLLLLLGILVLTSFVLNYPLFLSSVALAGLSFLLFLQRQRGPVPDAALSRASGVLPGALVLLLLLGGQAKAGPTPVTMSLAVLTSPFEVLDNNVGDVEEEPEYEQREEPEADEAEAGQAMPSKNAAEIDQKFDEMMAPQQALPQPMPSRAERFSVTDSLTSGAKAEVELPLAEFASVREKLNKLREQAAQVKGPAVVLGAAEYVGEAREGALALTVRMQVTLAHPNSYKIVPLAGDDVVLVSVSAGKGQLPVGWQNGYHVWVTKETGEVSLTLQLLVPPRGQRGSIEYDFVVPRTPATRFECRFPVPDLEPRITTAVHSEIRSQGGSTYLSATLRPTTRIHVVGFRDLGEEEGRQAKIYTESHNLVSVDEGTLELFSVIRYTILYAGTREFRILVPPDLTVMSADGEGAFSFELEKSEQGTLIKGETAFPIRNTYEISLRLRRETAKGRQTFVAPLPRCLGVEREYGWLGVEVPGKLQLEEETEARRDALAVDVRQLPGEMVDSAVSPILKAYRYNTPTATVQLTAMPLPQIEPASASIDQVRAHSVVSPDGKVLTEMRITLRNRLAHSLELVVPDKTEVRSTLLDGEPVKPSRDEKGQLVLPLKRSAGQDRLDPFTLQVVMEGSIGSFGLFGRPEMVLPALKLPVSSLQWTVYLPAKNTYTRLEGDIEPQRYVGTASWFQPTFRFATLTNNQALDEPAAAGAVMAAAASADTGAMPVRIQLPESGKRLELFRYWLGGDLPVRVSFWYLRSFLRPPLLLLAMALLVAGLVLLARGRQKASHPRRWRGAGGTMAAVAIVPVLGLGGLGYLVPALLATCLAVGLVSGVLRPLPAALVTWGRTLRERYAAERPEPAERTVKTVLWRLALGFGFFLIGILTLAALVRFLFLLARPLT